MYVVFADDAQQRQPSRDGMGPLVAIGGLLVPGDNVRDLELNIDSVCREAGFPDGEEFKWSPGRELWMRDNLIDDDRANFYARVLELIRISGAVAIVVLEDSTRNPATDAESAETDVTRLFLERIDRQVGIASTAIVVCDRPGGDRKDEEKFLSGTIETIKNGTEYSRLTNISLVLSTPSKLSRLLQIADVIASCTTALVSGENRWAPPVFENIKPLLAKSGSRIGGVGLKIHPNGRYRNLYHWVLKETHFFRRNVGYQIPMAGFPYAKDEWTR